MSMQSLKTIGQKVLKLEYGNEALSDRQTDGRMDTQSLEGMAGYKKNQTPEKIAVNVLNFKLCGFPVVYYFK